MGLLDKTNPHATTSSVVRHSIGWGIGGLVFWGLLAYFGIDPTDRMWPNAELWPIKLVVYGSFFAFVGGLMEWQLDDGPDDDDDPPVPQL